MDVHGSFIVSCYTHTKEQGPGTAKEGKFSTKPKIAKNPTSVNRHHLQIEDNLNAAARLHCKIKPQVMRRTPVGRGNAELYRRSDAGFKEIVLMS